MPVVDSDILVIKSPAFGYKEFIPQKYAVEGSNVNPPIEITGLPERTRSLVLIMDDPDAPGGTFDHWIVWNIPPGENVRENSAPGIVGVNSKGENSYYGPNPPPGKPHRYRFMVFALDTELSLPRHAGRKELIGLMEDYILASGELIGMYKR
jgi:hypothetical protein